MYFIYTEQHGFETEWFPSAEDAELHIVELHKWQGYRGITIEIIYVEQSFLSEGGDLVKWTAV